jgi:hypothetical protein
MRPQRTAGALRHVGVCQAESVFMGTERSAIGPVMSRSHHIDVTRPSRPLGPVPSREPATENGRRQRVNMAGVTRRQLCLWGVFVRAPWKRDTRRLLRARVLALSRRSGQKSARCRLFSLLP